MMPIRRGHLCLCKTSVYFFNPFIKTKRACCSAVLVSSIKQPNCQNQLPFPSFYMNLLAMQAFPFRPNDFYLFTLHVLLLPCWVFMHWSNDYSLAQMETT